MKFRCRVSSNPPPTPQKYHHSLLPTSTLDGFLREYPLSTIWFREGKKWTKKNTSAAWRLKASCSSNSSAFTCIATFSISTVPSWLSRSAFWYCLANSSSSVAWVHWGSVKQRTQTAESFFDLFVWSSSSSLTADSTLPPWEARTDSTTSLRNEERKRDEEERIMVPADVREHCAHFLKLQALRRWFFHWYNKRVMNCDVIVATC